MNGAKNSILIFKTGLYSTQLEIFFSIGLLSRPNPQMFQFYEQRSVFRLSNTRGEGGGGVFPTYLSLNG